jgi:hypothetical protein
MIALTEIRLRRRRTPVRRVLRLSITRKHALDARVRKQSCDVHGSTCTRHRKTGQHSRFHPGRVVHVHLRTDHLHQVGL